LDRTGVVDKRSHWLLMVGLCLGYRGIWGRGSWGVAIGLAVC